ncbi:hypothetical protein BH09MYX1_BH09MYX1_40940 [soil metagenome]
MPLRVAHVSDFHASTFGDTFHDRARIVKRSAFVADTSEHRYDVTWAEAGWRVLREKNGKKLLIVDPDGYGHAAPPRAAHPKLFDPLERAAAKACMLEARRAKTLASSPPSDGALAILADATPKNSNVRLLRAARVVERSDVDAIAITGDLTDDGDGYELVTAAFSRFSGRVFAVPGNHDRYLFPLSSSTRPKPTIASKTAAWQAYAKSLGLVLEGPGAWLASVRGHDDVVFVGLDSCARGQRRFFRQNGAIGEEQLTLLGAMSEREEWKRARHRVVLLHHHVVPLPHGVGRSAPSEIGMRLDDAREAATTFDRVGVTLVMHGHRHIGEERQPAGCKFRLLAAPSLTLGCRSGAGPSFWRVELGEHVHAERVAIPFEAIEAEETPDEVDH